MAVKASEKKSAGRLWLPKFDSTVWLVIGLLFSLVLFGLNLWSLIVQPDVPFFPFEAGKISGVIVGLGLAIHTIDMMGYYRKHGRLKNY